MFCELVYVFTFFDRQYSSESTQSMGYTLEEDLYSVNIYFPTNYFLINNIPRNPPNECNKSLIAWTLPPKMQNSLMGGGFPFKHVCNVCTRSLSFNPLNAKKKINKTCMWEEDTFALSAWQFHDLPNLSQAGKGTRNHNFPTTSHTSRYLIVYRPMFILEN